MRILGAIALVWAGLGLLSCGQKGPLQLPESGFAGQHLHPEVFIIADPNPYRL